VLFAHEDTQSVADKTRGPVPEIVENADGAAVIETFAIPSNRDGSPSHGVIMARMESGERTLARVDGTETAILSQLMDKSRYPIGDKGRVVQAEKGPSIWQPA